MRLAVAVVRPYDVIPEFLGRHRRMGAGVDEPTVVAAGAALHVFMDVGPGLDAIFLLAEPHVAVTADPVDHGHRGDRVRLAVAIVRDDRVVVEAPVVDLLDMLVRAGVLRAAVPADALILPVMRLVLGDGFARPDHIKPLAAVKAVLLGALFKGDLVGIVAVVLIDVVAARFLGLPVRVRAGVLGAAGPADALIVPAVLDGSGQAGLQSFP